VHGFRIPNHVKCLEREREREREPKTCKNRSCHRFTDVTRSKRGVRFIVSNEPRQRATTQTLKIKSLRHPAAMPIFFGTNVSQVCIGHNSAKKGGLHCASVLNHARQQPDHSRLAAFCHEEPVVWQSIHP